MAPRVEVPCAVSRGPFRLATPAGLGPTPRLVDSGLLIQEEQERQEAIEELQATFMGHQARQPVVRALQVGRRQKLDLLK